MACGGSSWRHCRETQIPDPLAHRIDMPKRTAYACHGDGELFRTDSWTQVMLGQHIAPATYHPVAHLLAAEELTKCLTEFRASIQQVVARMPVHQDFVNQYCKASNSVWN